MTLEVAQQCAEGNLTNCRCDTIFEGINQYEEWHWRGCPQKIDHSFEMITKFLKSEVENETDPDLKWMKGHNIRVGQEVTLYFTLYVIIRLGGSSTFTPSATNFTQIEGKNDQDHRHD